MMERILVEVGYLDFYFDCMQAAVAFAGTAARHIEDGVNKVCLTVGFVKEVEGENGSSNEED